MAMRFDDDQIIAFILGDVADNVARDIAQQMQHDVAFAARVHELQQLLGVLEQTCEEYEPPAGLVERTMERISAEADTLSHSATDSFTADSEFQTQPSSQLLGGHFSPRDAAPRPRRTFWDSTALTLSLSVLCCLALPALVRIRFESRKAQCANNIRQTGQALSLYALESPEQRLPEIESTGPGAFAGLYALKLNDSRLLNSFEQLFCPSVVQNNMQLMRQGSADAGQLLLDNLPSVGQLVLLDAEQLRAIQASVGGDYAFILGIIEEGVSRAPRIGQSHLAVLADAPVFYSGGETFSAHDGRGMNVLYGDGRVQFVNVPKHWSSEETQTLQWPHTTDDPFRNAAGEHRPGLHQGDASIAPSRISPAGL